MNKQRLKEIQDQSSTVMSVKDQLEEIKSALEEAQSDEQDYRDNMPENLQMSEKAERADNAISCLDDAISAIDDAISSLAVVESNIDGIE